MDYKEQIDTLRAYRIMTLERSMIDDALTNAADSIETLLAERDAAVEELHGECSKCRFSDFGAFDFPCFRCHATGGMTDYWQWRGPQKEGGA